MRGLHCTLYIRALPLSILFFLGSAQKQIYPGHSIHPSLHLFMHIAHITLKEPRSFIFPLDRGEKVFNLIGG